MCVYVHLFDTDVCTIAQMHMHTHTRMHSHTAQDVFQSTLGLVNYAWQQEDGDGYLMQERQVKWLAFIRVVE